MASERALHAQLTRYPRKLSRTAHPMVRRRRTFRRLGGPAGRGTGARTSSVGLWCGPVVTPASGARSLWAACRWLLASGAGASSPACGMKSPQGATQRQLRGASGQATMSSVTRDVRGPGGPGDSSALGVAVGSAGPSGPGDPGSPGSPRSRNRPRGPHFRRHLGRSGHRRRSTRRRQPTRGGSGTQGRTGPGSG